jgi:opacity protein-like surface antigen
MKFSHKLSQATARAVFAALGLTSAFSQTEQAAANPSSSHPELHLSFKQSPLTIAQAGDPTAPSSDPTAPSTPTPTPESPTPVPAPDGSTPPAPQAPESQPSTVPPVSETPATEGSKWYGGLGIGLNSPSLNRTVGLNGGAAGNLNSDLKLDIDSGVGFSGFVGYKFTGFRVEGEAMYSSNSFSGITARTPVGTNTETARLFGTTGSIGNISNFAVMLNGYYDVPTGTAITPFLGAGVGYGTSNVSGITNITLFGQNVSPVPAGGSSSGIAYQLKAGANYALSSNNDVYVQYRYLNGSGDSNYSTNNIELGTKLSF